MDANDPQQVAARVLEACLALATGSLAAETFDAHRAAAYERACGLAEFALGHAMALAGPQQPTTQLEAGLAELAGVAQLLAEAVTTPTGRPCGPTELENNP